MGQLTRLAKRAFNAIGLEVARREQGPQPVPVYDELQEAIHRGFCGDPASFLAPVDRCRTFNGFSFGRAGWHPFVATARDMLTSQRIRPFDESVLARYYEVWKPRDARDAMIKPECGPSELSAYPPYTHHLPWLEVTPEQRSRHIAKIIVEENRALGAHELDASHGHGFHGPVSTAKGLLEFGRIRHLVESIGRSGYDRRISGADPTAEAIFRGTDVILRITHGHHRIAVLAASGISHVPITVTKVVRADECEHWTSVVRGPWTKDQAMMLVEHLFLFDSMNWAIGKGLASG